MQLTALLVDDEAPARDELSYMVEATGKVRVIGECEDGDEVLEFLRHTPVDVVFLDIQMRVQDGLTTAWQIMAIENPPKIVFTTGFSEYAQQAFEVNAVDYMVKPYMQERVDRCIAKIRDNAKTGLINQHISTLIASGTALRPNRLVAWRNDRLMVVPYPDILYAKADENRKTALVTAKGAYTTDLTLKELEDKLKPPTFLRTHKSYIANLDKVLEIIPWFNSTFMLKLQDCEDHEIPVGRHYMKVFQSTMGIE